MIEREKLVRQKENVSERRTLQTKKKKHAKRKRERLVFGFITTRSVCACVCGFITDQFRLGQDGELEKYFA